MVVLMERGQENPTDPFYHNHEDAGKIYFFLLLHTKIPINVYCVLFIYVTDDLKTYIEITY